MQIPWTGRDLKGAEPPLVIRGGGQDPLDRRSWRGAGPPLVFREGEGQDPLGHMFLHHTDSFHIAYLNTTVHFNGLNRTAYTRPSRVRNNTSQ